MAGFTYKGNLHGQPACALESRIIANSKTVYVGGLVSLLGLDSGSTEHGAVQDVAAGEGIFGLCLGLIDKDSVPLEKTLYTLDGTHTAGSYGAENYAAASDNETDKQIRAVIQPLRMGDKINNTPDTAIGTTDGSDKAGGYTDIVSSIQVDENNNGNGFVSTAQLGILGTDPEDSSKGLYTVNELQFGTGNVPPGL